MTPWLPPLSLTKSFLKAACSAIFFLLMFSGAAACQRATPVITEPVVRVEERSVREIPLFGPAASSQAEISGMAWCGDDLIMLPQYPGRFPDEDSAANLFSIVNEEISGFLSGESQGALEPALISFDQGDLEGSITGFEGFEAIAFSGDRFYVTIEASPPGGMMGYLVAGEVDEECTNFVIDPDTLIEIPPQADLKNMSDETLVVYEDLVYSIYEANGANVNPDPTAHVFNESLEDITQIPLPNIEYRITDATTADENGEFWAINYFFPGDQKLEPAPDPIASEHGLGDTHRGAAQVERLVAFEILDDQIVLADQAPIYLELAGVLSRNWEGIVRFGDGFLLVTDFFPRTIFGYVEGP